MPLSRHHTEKAKTDLDRATSFEVIVETSTGAIEYTAAVDEDTYPSGRTAAHKRIWLLGQHIHWLAAELGGLCDTGTGREPRARSHRLGGPDR